MLLDDCPAYPMSFFVRLRFSGRVNRTQLQQAIDVAQQRHPLLSATVEAIGKKRFRWVAAEDSQVTLVWRDVSPTDEFPRLTHLALKKNVGLRVFVSAGSEATDVTLQLHHSCCDGKGALQFAEDLLILYASSFEDSVQEPELQPVDRELLQRRHHFGLTKWEFLRILPKQFVGLFGAWQFLVRKPVPIIPHEPVSITDETPAAYPAVAVHRFDLAETEDIRGGAKSQGVSNNDLLIRDLFLAISDWRSRACPGQGEDWLRLSIPVNLRNEGDEQMPAANVVSMVFLDRRDPHFDAPSELLADIHEEMSLIKRLRLGLTYVFSLQVFKVLPGGLARAARDEQCFATAVLTNLGKVFSDSRLARNDQGRLVVGDLVLNDVDVLPPIRPLTSAGFSLLCYAGRLSIGLHYDPRSLNKDMADDILKTYVSFVRKSMGNRSNPVKTPGETV